MASVKMQEAYDTAKASKPRTRITVYTDSYGFGGDDKYKKEELARKKASLKALQADMKKFDRDHAADRVYASMLREEMRLKNDIELCGMEGDD